jgi:polysaccharide export outer membrane protein
MRRTTDLGVGAALTLFGALALGGCEMDSYLDPSVMGRWEHTPTTVPILERIAAIEVGDATFVQTSQILPEDLIPEVEAYRLGPGDQLEVRVRDLFQLGREEQFFPIVDARGFINIQRLPAIRVSGMTADEVREAIVETIRQEQIKENAVVSVQVAAQRQQTFHALGGVGAPGSYLIPEPDYRLLEALTAAGGLNESVAQIFIIRQIPLRQDVEGVEGAPRRGGEGEGAQPAAPVGEDLIDLIDELAEPDDQDDGGMAVFGGGIAVQPGDRPAVDLPNARPGVRQPSRGAQGESTWKWLNGQWVRVTTGGPAVQGRGRRGPTLVTQRVIEVQTKPLLAGAAEYNIVIRPGDIIRVPSHGTALYYMGGQLARPGAFNIPPSGRTTLVRAIDAAGGLSQLAVPERCDLTRMIGPNRQATIRLNLRAIAEGRQPDIFLKPDDRINIGTDFWAFPLAVIRNGFRFSYGFGFLLDRNFGNDVFGPPPRDDSFF